MCFDKGQRVHDDDSTLASRQVRFLPASYGKYPGIAAAFSLWLSEQPWAVKPRPQPNLGSVSTHSVAPQRRGPSSQPGKITRDPIATDTSGKPSWQPNGAREKVVCEDSRVGELGNQSMERVHSLMGQISATLSSLSGSLSAPVLPVHSERGANTSIPQPGTSGAGEQHADEQQNRAIPKGERTAEPVSADPTHSLGAGAVNPLRSRHPLGNPGLDGPFVGIATGASLASAVKYGVDDAGRDRGERAPANPNRAESLCGSDQVVLRGGAEGLPSHTRATHGHSTVVGPNLGTLHQKSAASAGAVNPPIDAHRHVEAQVSHANAMIGGNDERVRVRSRDPKGDVSARRSIEGPRPHVGSEGLESLGLSQIHEQVNSTFISPDSDKHAEPAKTEQKSTSKRKHRWAKFGFHPVSSERAEAHKRSESSAMAKPSPNPRVPGRSLKKHKVKARKHKRHVARAGAKIQSASRAATTTTHTIPSSMAAWGADIPLTFAEAERLAMDNAAYLASKTPGRNTDMRTLLVHGPEGAVEMIPVANLNRDRIRHIVNMSSRRYVEVHQGNDRSAIQVDKLMGWWSLTQQIPNSAQPLIPKKKKKQHALSTPAAPPRKTNRAKHELLLVVYQKGKVAMFRVADLTPNQLPAIAASSTLAQVDLQRGVSVTQIDITELTPSWLTYVQTHGRAPPPQRKHTRGNRDLHLTAAQLRHLQLKRERELAHAVLQERVDSAKEERRHARVYGDLHAEAGKDTARPQPAAKDEWHDDHIDIDLTNCDTSSSSVDASVWTGEPTKQHHRPQEEQEPDRSTDHYDRTTDPTTPSTTDHGDKSDSSSSAFLPIGEQFATPKNSAPLGSPGSAGPAPPVSLNHDSLGRMGTPIAAYDESVRLGPASIVLEDVAAAKGKNTSPPPPTAARSKDEEYEVQLRDLRRELASSRLETSRLRAEMTTLMQLVRASMHGSAEGKSTETKEAAASPTGSPLEAASAFSAGSDQSRGQAAATPGHSPASLVEPSQNHTHVAPVGAETVRPYATRATASLGHGAPTPDTATRSLL